MGLWQHCTQLTATTHLIVLKRAQLFLPGLMLLLFGLGVNLLLTFLRTTRKASNNVQGASIGDTSTTQDNVIGQVASSKQNVQVGHIMACFAGFACVHLAGFARRASPVTNQQLRHSGRYTMVPLHSLTTIITTATH